MDQNLKQMFARGRSKNEQVAAEIWHRLRECYAAGPSQMETVRKAIHDEAMMSLFCNQGMLGTYLMVRRDLLNLAIIALQDKMGEWMEAGEIPPGEIGD